MEKSKSKKTAYVFLVVVIAFVMAIALARQAINKREAPKEPKEFGISVKVATARIGSMDSVIEVSGDLKALKAVSLSPKMALRVTSVPYREGDLVRAGAVVVQQDTSDLRAQVRQAEAALEAARARLSQAITNDKVSDTQIESQIVSAKAALDAARARLQMLKKGARAQEIAQAENALASAKANYDNAKANLERMRNLFAQGAISPQQMDQAQTQYDIASAQYGSAKEQLSLIKAGAREEEIEAAEKQVEQADQAYRIALSNRAQKDLRREDINSARAGVTQAEANLAYARQQLVNASVLSPITGTVSKRMTEPGQMGVPGVPVMEIVALNTVYFDATLSEMDAHKVRVGQPVEVRVDAIPGKKFRGNVIKILPTENPKNRQLSVWISLPNANGELKPGMFARGNVLIARHKKAVIIPKDALMASETGYSVYRVTDSTAHFQPVTVGFETRDEVEILAGVSPGDLIVISGQDKLSDGVKVNVAN